jgi:hypothetical protein
MRLNIESKKANEQVVTVTQAGDESDIDIEINDELVAYLTVIDGKIKLVRVLLAYAQAENVGPAVLVKVKNTASSWKLEVE